MQPDPSSEPGFEAGIAGDDRAGEQEEGPFSAPEAGACMEELQKAQEQLAQMKQQLSLKDAQMEELLSRFQRLQADFENFRKRTQKEKEEMLQTAAASLVEKILPVMDNFQRAANAAGAEEESFREGVEMIFKQLKKPCQMPVSSSWIVWGNLLTPTCSRLSSEWRTTTLKRIRLLKSCRKAIYSPEK